MIKSSYKYLLLIDNNYWSPVAALSTPFLRSSTSSIPGVFCGRSGKHYPISLHIENISTKSLFSLSITGCIPSEPWWVCNLQSLNYPRSNHISLFYTQFWHEPWWNSFTQSSIALTRAQFLLANHNTPFTRARSHNRTNRTMST